MKKPLKTTGGNKKPKKPQQQADTPPRGRGQPSSITPEKRAVFLAALENGLKIGQALIQAKYSEDAHKRLMKKSVEYRTEIAVAKEKLSMLAKSGMAQKIQQQDGPMIRWYLERHEPDEFRPQAGDDNMPTLPPNMVWVIPGGRHPRITPKDEIQED